MPQIAVKEERRVLCVRKRRFERQGAVLGGRAASVSTSCEELGNGLGNAFAGEAVVRKDLGLVPVMTGASGRLST